MAGGTILAAVDEAEESVAAAAMAWGLASTSGSECQLVHITSDVSRMPATLPPLPEIDQLMEYVQSSARTRIQSALAGHVPDALVENLHIRMGRAAWVLPYVIEDFNAEMLVLGKKRHTGPTRWFGGSTVHHVVRTVDIPMLIAHPATKSIKRILVAVDLSHAMAVVLQGVTKLAAITGAELRVIHVVEPLPDLSEFPVNLDDTAYAKAQTDRFEELMDVDAWRNFDRVVREGSSAKAIAEEAESWKADVVAAGTHGAGWLDRVLLGSTTNRLLNRYDGSMYVVPVEAPNTES